MAARARAPDRLGEDSAARRPGRHSGMAALPPCTARSRRRLVRRPARPLALAAARVLRARRTCERAAPAGPGADLRARRPRRQPRRPSRSPDRPDRPSRASRSSSPTAWRRRGGWPSCPTASALVTERDTARVLRVPAAGGDPVEVTTVAGGGRRAARAACWASPSAPRTPPTARSTLYVTTAEDNRVVRFRLPHSRPGADRAGPHRHPEGHDPQRRAAGVRPGRRAVRRHRRHRRHLPGAGPGLARRQGAAHDAGRRAGRGRRLARVLPRPPQRAGPRLRRRRAAVRGRVRPEPLRRGQPGRRGQQRRLAGGRGRRRRRRAASPPRSSPGRPPRPPRAAPRSSATRCTSPRCAASGCGRCRSTAAAARGEPVARFEGEFGRLRTAVTAPDGSAVGDSRATATGAATRPTPTTGSCGFTLDRARLHGDGAGLRHHGAVTTTSTAAGHSSAEAQVAHRRSAEVRAAATAAEAARPLPRGTRALVRPAGRRDRAQGRPRPRCSAWPPRRPSSPS